MTAVADSWKARLRQGLKWASVALDQVMPTTGVVVLAYHRIGGDGTTQMDLPTDRFRRQMAELVSLAEVVSLDDALDHLAGPATSTQVERPRVVLTFDDGTLDFVEGAIKVLEEFELPATLYAATGPIETGETWPDGAAPLTWAALADVTGHPLITVGCHSHEHLLLDRAAPSVVATDLDRSIDLLGERCGVQPQHFAYPKALAPAPANEALVRSRFRSAALAGTRPNRPGRSDPYRLFRSPIQRADAPHHVARKMAGGMRLEDDVRRLAHRISYRGARW